MYGINFKTLLEMTLNELNRDNSIFSIPSDYFFSYKNGNENEFHGSFCSNPVGPAAGPHTQLAHNISALYLTGARVFELKTVQVLDGLEFPKPCIDSSQECYNTEWSTELSIENAIDEYTKAFILNYFLDKLLNLTENSKPSFIFDMSVGYDFKGICSEKVNNFLNILSGIKENKLLSKYKLEAEQKGNFIKSVNFNDFANSIPDKVSASVTLSTMHGCPVEEIEEICKYLMEKKGLNTCLKLNPTLIGYDAVRKLLDNAGYTHIELLKKQFDNDLKLKEALQLISNLQKFSLKCKKQFTIKLTNTLPVANKNDFLDGKEKYMSGRPLFLLTTSLANILLDKLSNMNFSFSGGVSVKNASLLVDAGIGPVTLVTDLLKPKGLKKFYEIAKSTECLEIPKFPIKSKINSIVKNSIESNEYSSIKPVKKSSKQLPLFDCFRKKICGKCVDVCPNRANILIRIDEEEFKADYQILHLSELCNECGNCGVFCPYSGLPYKDKLSFYNRKSEFESEVNNGFIISKNDKNFHVKLKLNKRIYLIKFNENKEFVTISSNCRHEPPDENLGSNIIVIETFLKNYREYYDR